MNWIHSKKPPQQLATSTDCRKIDAQRWSPALENCGRQLKHVRLELTELKRVGPREGFKRLRDNRIATEREIEREGSLISICTASWNGFHSKNEIFQDHGKRPEKQTWAKRGRRLLRSARFFPNVAPSIFNALAPSGLLGRREAVL
jgi:hypothetical protein